MRLYQSEFPAVLHQTQVRRLINDRQRGVGEYPEIHNQALSDPVLGDIGDPGLHGVRWGPERNRLISNPDGPPARLIDTKQDASNFGSTAPNQAPESQNFPRSQRKRYFTEDARTRKSVYFQDWCAKPRTERRIHLRKGSTNHQLHCPIPRHLVKSRDCHQAAVAQHRHSIRDPIDFIHSVAHEHHSDPPLPQRTHDIKKPAHLTLR